jgi:hypothetical protein
VVVATTGPAREESRAASVWWTQRRGYTPHRQRKHQHTREHHKKDTQNQHGHAAILETGKLTLLPSPAFA